MPLCSRLRGVSAASFVGLATLVGCQESDVEQLEAMSREGAFDGAPVDAHGKFTTRIWNMLDGSRKVTHHLVDYTARVDTELVLEDGVELTRDAMIDAWGERDDEGRLIVDSFEVVAWPPQPLIDAEPRPPRRIATISVNLGDADAGAPGNATTRGSMYTNPDSTNVYYAENSYGIETMAGDTFGPYTIADPGGCSPGQIEFLARDAMVEHGHDPDQWIQHMYVFYPQLPDCGFAGLASVGSVDQPASGSWYNGSFSCVVRNQELGHNYGMGHSHSYDCADEEGNDVPFSPTCGEIEYGDPYDPMGGGCGHINGIQKRYMGWIDDCNIVTATNNGTFNLMPIELPCDGTQALRFPTFDGRYYWLEYRTVAEVFGTFEGVIVRVAADTNGPPNPFWIDLGAENYLREGDSFTDPEGVVTFTVLEFAGTHAVIEATFAEPSGDAPTCLGGGDPGMDGGHVGQRVCADAPYTGDMEPPTITLTFPEDEAWIEPGSDFTITADVADDRVVVDVELYLNGEKLFRITEPPWEWDVTNVPEGEYEFGAIARDSRYATPSNAVDVHVGVMPPMDESGGSDESGVDPTATATDGLTGGEVDESGGDEAPDTDGDADEMASDEKGCACSQSGREGAPAFALLVLGLAWARRRREVC
jgi:MYXO-CTERM domain-containing protein